LRKPLLLNAQQAFRDAMRDRHGFEALCPKEKIRTAKCIGIYPFVARTHFQPKSSNAPHLIGA